MENEHLSTQRAIKTDGKIAISFLYNILMRTH